MPAAFHKCVFVQTEEQQLTDFIQNNSISYQTVWISPACFFFLHLGDVRSGSVLRRPRCIVVEGAADHKSCLFSLLLLDQSCVLFLRCVCAQADPGVRASVCVWFVGVLLECVCVGVLRVNMTWLWVPRMFCLLAATKIEFFN